MEHEVLIYNKTKRRVPKKFIKGVVLRALDFLKLKQPAELAVLVISSNEIKMLNKVWRKKDETPDELSFGLNSRQISGFANDKVIMLSLGEIVLNVEKISSKIHLSKLLIHSLLHLLGHGHEKSEVKAKKMEQLEIKIFKRLNIFRN